MTRIFVPVLCFLLASCGYFDPNASPRYGDTGLAVNCRAYVQVVIDSYRARQFSADESFNALERNCGLSGHAWGK